MKYKKLYSLNLIAYVYMVSKIEPILQKDSQGTIYFLFPDTESLTFIINTYRVGNPIVGLRDFTNTYRYLRKLMGEYHE